MRVLSRQVGDITRFGTEKMLSAYAGLDPSLKVSAGKGSQVRRADVGTSVLMGGCGSTGAWLLSPEEGQ